MSRLSPFTRISGIVLPLDRANVDTDQIIPKQYLKSVRRTGFGDNLFDAWRFLDEGALPKTRAWPLVGNKSPRSSLMVVDLPEPLGPNNPKTSPRFTSRSSALSAFTFWRPQKSR